MVQYQHHIHVPCTFLTYCVSITNIDAYPHAPNPRYGAALSLSFSLSICVCFPCPSGISAVCFLVDGDICCYRVTVGILSDLMFFYSLLLISLWFYNTVYRITYNINNNNNKLTGLSIVLANSRQFWRSLPLVRRSSLSSGRGTVASRAIPRFAVIVTIVVVVIFIVFIISVVSSSSPATAMYLRKTRTNGYETSRPPPSSPLQTWYYKQPYY